MLIRLYKTRLLISSCLSFLWSFSFENLKNRYFLFSIKSQPYPIVGDAVFKRLPFYTSYPPGDPMRLNAARTALIIW